MAPVDGCRFCAIVAGEEHGHVVFEDEISLAFLDHRPLFPGHSLLVPREHSRPSGTFPTSWSARCSRTPKSLSAAIRSAMGARARSSRLNNIVSQSVPHLHVHLVPRNRKDGLRGFFWPRRKYDSEEHMRETAARSARS